MLPNIEDLRTLLNPSEEVKETLTHIGELLVAAAMSGLTFIIYSFKEDLLSEADLDKVFAFLEFEGYKYSRYNDAWRISWS